MSIEIKVPSVGESVQEVQVSQWLKSEGDFVREDEAVVELETDKASLEVYAPRPGVLAKIVKQAGESVAVDDVLAILDDEAKPGESRAESLEQGNTSALETPREPVERPKATEPQSSEKRAPESAPNREPAGESDDGIRVTPSARRALRQHGLVASDVAQRGARITEADVERFVEAQQKPTAPQERPRAGQVDRPLEEGEEVVPMSLIRRRIAERLVEAQQTAALLTTFNEIDMSAVIALRREFGERFRDEYDVKLGFMSFFVKATIEALKRCPELNAELRGRQIVYRHFYHVGVAIGAKKGLVVPVLRHAERLSFAEIERAIADFSARAQSNKLEPSDLEGGTFTISNGGVYGSLLSTPIVNPPQSGVLGMHAIQERPIAHEGAVVIRPMMYVALTYDHRLVDGREAVTFLKHVKETIEEPAQMLIEV